MMKAIDKTRTAVLDLGLEDWIPIPEAMASPEVADAIGAEHRQRILAEALSSLLSEGRIRLYRGRWDADSDPVPLREALLLVEDEQWYEFHLDDPDEERLYFVNVANIREA